MIKIGLCGSSGSGKGYVGELLQKHGLAYIDTDKVYNEVTRPNSKCLDELCAFFGSEILNDDKTLDKKILAKKVFEDENAQENLKMLNTISHKHIKIRTKELISEFELKGYKAVLIDAPVLFESKFNEMCDFTVFVSAPYETKIKRIVKRDKITEEKARVRLKNQLTDNELRKLCDFEINNNDGSDLEKEINKVLKGIALE